jgi:hypothetical protein
MNLLSFVRYRKNRQQPESIRITDHLWLGAYPMLMIYRMAVIKFELRLRFPYYNVSMVSRQNSSLHISKLHLIFLSW